MNYEKLCKEVLDSDSKIRFVGVLNSRGELTTQKSKSDSPLLSEDEVKMSIHYTFEHWNRVKNLEHKLGKEKSFVTEHENVTLFSLFFDGNLLLLSTEPNSSCSKIISNVRKIITKIVPENKTKPKTSKTEPKTSKTKTSPRTKITKKNISELKARLEMLEKQIDKLSKI